MKRLLTAGLFLVWAALGLAQPGGAALRVVEWDATGIHSATDREWFYRSLGTNGQIQQLPNGGGVYPEIEFSETYDEGAHGIYVPILSDVKGSSFSIRVRIRNTNLFTHYTGTLIPETAELVRTSAPGSPVFPLTVSVASGSLSIAPMATQDVTLQIGGLPNFVTHGDFRVSFRAEGNIGLGPPGGPLVGLATSIERRLCVTDGVPVGIQNVVWNDLLDMYACRWAEGESGVTDVRQRLLENLHFPDGGLISTREDPFTLSYQRRTSL